MSWDSQLQEYMLDGGACSAAALAQMSDGAFYAAAPVADEAGWAMVFKDPHEQKIMQEDGSEKAITINEATQLKSLMDNLKTPAGGVWLGGIKYTVPRFVAEEELGEGTCKWCFGAAPKKGVHMITTGTQILCGFWDDEKGQNSGNCKKAVLEMGVYLVGEGY